MRGRVFILLALLLMGCDGTARVERAASLPAEATGATTPPTVFPVTTNAPVMAPTPPLPTPFPALVAGRHYVFVVDYYATVRIVDPRMLTVVGTLPIGQGALPVFAPDGSRLFVTHYGQRWDIGAQLDIFDMATGRRIAGVGGLDLMAYKIWGPPIIAPSRDGRTVYLHGRRTISTPGKAGQDQCWIYAFDIATDRLLSETIPLPTCRVAPLILSADGGTLYSGPWLVDLTTSPATVRENADLANTAVAQSADRRWLYALDQGGAVTVWDTDARRIAQKFADAVPRYGSFLYLHNPALSLTRDGARLFVATDDGNHAQQEFVGVSVLDIANGNTVAMIRMDHPFRAFAASADGARLYTIARDALEIWDVSTGMRRGTVNGLGGSAGPVMAPPPTL